MSDCNYEFETRDKADKWPKWIILSSPFAKDKIRYFDSPDLHGAKAWREAEQ